MFTYIKENRNNLESIAAWDVKQCSFVDVYRRFGGTTIYIFKVEVQAEQERGDEVGVHLLFVVYSSVLRMVIVSSSETLVN
jgi:hypothetical protein